MSPETTRQTVQHWSTGEAATVVVMASTSHTTYAVHYGSDGWVSFILPRVRVAYFSSYEGMVSALNSQGFDVNTLYQLNLRNKRR